MENKTYWAGESGLGGLIWDIILVQHQFHADGHWIPASAGMTERGNGVSTTKHIVTFAGIIEFSGADFIIKKRSFQGTLESSRLWLQNHPSNKSNLSSIALNNYKQGIGKNLKVFLPSVFSLSPYLLHSSIRLSGFSARARNSSSNTISGLKSLKLR